MAQDRATFRELARTRLREARLLANEGHFSGAYYLAGYAIECALKARIANQFRADEIPDKALVNKVYTQNLLELLRLSGLQTELEAAEEDAPDLARRWQVVRKWSEAARYDICAEEIADAMLDAVGDEASGIFQWLTDRW